MKPPRSTASAEARRDRTLFPRGALARLALPLDLAALAALMFVAPLTWELPERAPVQIPLALTALAGVFVAGGYRLALPVRRAAALHAATGLFVGLVIGWLVDKLLAAKFGMRELTPPGLEGFAVASVVAALLVGLGRVALLHRLRARERSARVLVLGPPDAARALEARLRRHHEPSPVEALQVDDLEGALASPELRALVLAEAPTGWPRSTLEAVAIARAQGLHVTTPARFAEDLFRRTPIDALDDPWLVLDEALTRRSTLYVGTKRLMDLTLGGLALALSLPLMALIAIAVRLSGPGPILYRQARAGLHREPFTLYKFRTMRPDAEDETGPIWAAENDPRATPVGRLLRRARLDELPQLFNVLRGHMSLVGPRPERPELERELAPRLPLYVLRHLAKPGITGWAQVRLPYGASVEDSSAKLEHDLYYLKRATIGFDLVILLRTIPVVLGLHGR
ncbi:MAG: exopolysaccharide biosynthesis polyprenyl glycosylphosphotransferase [Deltaproteobacteria bacterium]|nr:exopolysaccharide biosynthesis polyprenyl glycosylphosphotransferase [Deltaproteobacteria bacterium]